MREREQIPTGLWMVPYADLMSTMVILFLALFAYNYVRRPPQYNAAVARMQVEIAPELEARLAKSRLKEAMLAADLERKLTELTIEEFGVLVTEDRIQLTLPAPVLFSAGHATLTPEAGPVLDAVAKLAAELPNPILVEGHTDDQPIVGSHGQYRNNWELSAGRAFAVIDHLVSKQLPAGRFNARGYAEHRPVAPNATEAGRGRNRRIEISFVRGTREDAQ